MNILLAFKAVPPTTSANKAIAQTITPTMAAEVNEKQSQRGCSSEINLQINLIEIITWRLVNLSLKIGRNQSSQINADVEL